MEYIEREAVVQYLLKCADGYSYIETPTEQTIQAVNAIPAADVVPVRHGRWIVDDITGLVKCSICKNDAPLDTTGGGQWRSPFCPNCGVRTDAEEREKRIRKAYIDVGSCRGWIVEGGLDKDGDGDV